MNNDARRRKTFLFAQRYIGYGVAALGLFLFPALLAFGLPTTPVKIDGKSIDLADVGSLYDAGDGTFPERAQDIPALLAQLKPARNVNLLGGGYWLYAELQHSSPVSEWVLDPNNTLIDRIEARIYAPDGRVQQVLTGYRYDHQYMLHYGKSINLQPNVVYRVLIKFSSPYFGSQPRFEVCTETSYRSKVLGENLLIVGCLGALASLALFNLTLFVATGDKVRSITPCTSSRLVPAGRLLFIFRQNYLGCAIYPYTTSRSS